MFLSYARKDKEHSDELRVHLAQLVNQGIIELFVDEDTESGTQWKPHILRQLEAAPIILVLVSRHYLASEWIYQHELPVISERYNANTNPAVVVPALLDTCGWQESALEEIQFIDHEPVLESDNPQAALLAIAKDLRKHVELLRSTPEPIDENAGPVDHWRAYLRTVHCNLVPFFPEARSTDLGEIYVELEVQPEAAAPDGCDEGESRLHHFGATTLHDLLSGPSAEDKANFVRRTADGASEPAAEIERPRHWLIAGAPGAGKSTVARHLTRELANDADGPIPVFLSIQRWIQADQHPFAVAEADLRSARDAAAERLANELHVAAEPDSDRAVWLFLDGLDEVDPHRLSDARQKIEHLASSTPELRIVVLSRPVGLADLAGFRRASLTALPEDRRPELIERWVGKAHAAEVWASIQKRPNLLAITGNPLLLTLVSMLALRDPDLPPNLLHLYEAATDLLLTRGFGQQPRAVKDPKSAQRILAELSLHLQAGEAVSYSADQLDDALVELVGDDDKLATRLRVWNSSPTQFLDDIATHSGILAPHDGPREPWRFLHRTLGEYLAARALADRGEGELLRRVEELDSEDLGRWGETLGMACGCAAAPLELLAKLRDASAALALRILPTVDPLSPEEKLDFLLATDGWSADDLRRVVLSWGLESDAAQDRAAATLWRAVTKERSTQELAYVHFVWTKHVGPVDRDRFFAAADCPLEVPTIDTATIAAGMFAMGGTRLGDEQPVHEVSLDAFALGTYPVTNEQYAAFVPHHEPRAWDSVDTWELARHPVVVSWWEAYLFCAWAGGYLPTEAQWEYACRAGTTTEYWSGDTEADLERVGWVLSNSDRRTHVVGEKPANQFGLHDVHGNVLEWCRDWVRSFENSVQLGDGERMGKDASGRVLRGGGWGADAVDARSASRFAGPPELRTDIIGFRLARAID